MILFYIKKFIGMILMPIPLTLLTLTLALCLISRFPKLGKSLIILSILLLGLTSWSPVANRLIATVEGEYSVFDIAQPVDVVIVLGSGHNEHANMPAVMQLGRSAIFRLEEGLRILRANPNARLFVSGYGAGGRTPHAEILKQAAIELGIAPTRITTFPLAKDTEDEARMMASFLKDDKERTSNRIALVTEASHLKRAMRFYRNEGINTLPAPAFKLGASEGDLSITATAAYKSQRAFYEWLGLTWQAIKSQILNN
ncbi:ElyC/SanA/YdcF family protein [Marinomonas mediterranea]|uniref:ElyC/SanA/YdcF family protein n=2 Tax=Marinomonas mediterranea TaxID=119864 RepID=UPI00234A1311|nr:ElyC/SanA/YdcF family protein [Marinomonas mediterranea]WCN10703.1 hypothetical protein GV055_18120 [Marinomonas mediterranea]WCN14760.1 hypothetical protein GV054_17995 [Marinomonas mediterranea]